MFTQLTLACHPLPLLVAFDLKTKVRQVPLDNNGSIVEPWIYTAIIWFVVFEPSYTQSVSPVPNCVVTLLNINCSFWLLSEHNV